MKICSQIKVGMGRGRVCGWSCGVAFLCLAAATGRAQDATPQPGVIQVMPAAPALPTQPQMAQQLGQNPSSASNQYYGSITVGTVTGDTLHLSLDDSINRGIQNNLAITQARVSERQASAQRLQSLQPLLPTLMAQATSGAHQFNLAEFGFGPSLISKFGTALPGFNPANVKLIVKVNVTQAEATYRETFFDLPAIERYRAAKVNMRAAYYGTQSSRGLVVLNVGNTYLQALADGTQIDSDNALLRADELLLKQVEAEHEAGVVANLDLLRARVQYQTQQQKVIADQNTYDKQLILLQREIGVPVEQKIQLTDASPYADLETMSIEDARRQAYNARQDYLGMQQQLLAADLTRKAAKYERLPTLSADGNYGVTGETGGLYHGTFIAEGTLEVPIFREARFRGDAHVAEANQNSLRQQLLNMREAIDQQLRDSMLDIQSANELIRVAQSNVTLATRELEQANDRFAAGVSDNLPVVQAQATLSGAQTQLINDQLQYNQAKLGLARNLGIVDTQYKRYLHGK